MTAILNGVTPLSVIGKRLPVTWLAAPEYIKYVSNFRIGFCFYDWNLIKNDFNYQTAPSGKLFVYLSAGLPVIVCNIPGFKFHGLTGNRKGTYSVTGTGNWRITFCFDGEDAIDLNLEDYH